jgi:hypothetical protein
MFASVPKSFFKRWRRRLAWALGAVRLPPPDVFSSFMGAPKAHDQLLSIASPVRLSRSYLRPWPGFFRGRVLAGKKLLKGAPQGLVKKTFLDYIIVKRNHGRLTQW